MTDHFITHKIIYGDSPTTLTMTYPSINKAGDSAYWQDERQADREDVVTISGIQQTFFYRSDVFKTLQLDWVPNTDLAAWASFMDDWALRGKPFSFYPDAANDNVHNDFTLADKQWKPARAVIGYSKFTLKLRKVLPDSASS